MTRRRLLLLLLSVGVSALFLWVALRDVPAQEVIATIQNADLGWVALSFAFATGALYLRGLRWRALLMGGISARRAFFMFSATMLLNQLPLRVGEVGRVLLTAREGIPVSVAASAAIFERLTDTLIVVIVLALSVSGIAVVPAIITQTVIFFAVGVAVGYTVILMVARYPRLATAALDWIERRLPLMWRLIARLHPRTMVANIQNWLARIVTARGLAVLIGWSLVGWACSFATFYCLERALRIEGVDLVLMMFLGVALATFTVAIPVSVASVGPFESAVRAAGDLVGMEGAASAALGFVVHGMTIFSYAVWGVVGLIALGVSFSDVMQRPPPAPRIEAKLDG